MLFTFNFKEHRLFCNGKNLKLYVAIACLIHKAITNYRLRIGWIIPKARAISCFDRTYASLDMTNCLAVEVVRCCNPRVKHAINTSAIPSYVALRCSIPSFFRCRFLLERQRCTIELFEL